MGLFSCAISASWCELGGDACKGTCRQEGCRVPWLRQMAGFAGCTLMRIGCLIRKAVQSKRGLSG